MIKVNPALRKGQTWCEPALVCTCTGTKINDLQNIAGATYIDHVADQLGEERVDCRGTGRRVGGYAGGEPARVDDRFRWRSR